MDKKIKLVVGPMFSKKSFTLINDYLQDKGTKEVFKSGLDTREIGFVKSRAITETVPCKTVKDIKEVLNSKAEHIYIDEYQFCQAEQLLDVIKGCKEKNKKLSMYGLDYLANGEEWASYTAIKNKVDQEVRLTARCEICGEPATKTMLESLSKDLIQIESELTKYYPVCEKHFHCK